MKKSRAPAPKGKTGRPEGAAPQGGNSNEKVRGSAFRLTGLILGIIGITVSVTSIVFSAVGLHRARLCKHCKTKELYE